MSGSQTGALVEQASTMTPDQSLITQDEDVRLSLPETTMVIIGTTGMLWASLYGAFNALFG